MDIGTTGTANKGAPGEADDGPDDGAGNGGWQPAADDAGDGGTIETGSDDSPQYASNHDARFASSGLQGTMG